MTRTPKAAAALKPSRTRKAKSPNGADAPLAAAKPPAAAATEASPPVPKGKLALLASLLRREEGATLADMAAATGWQAHSVRGAIAGSLKRAQGLAVTSTKVEGAARIYRIAR